MAWGATEDRLRAFIRDDEAALLRPQFEERGSASRGRLRNLDFRHVGSIRSDRGSFLKAETATGSEMLCSRLLIEDHHNGRRWGL
jgi:hypothetical protein